MCKDMENIRESGVEIGKEIGRKLEAQDTALRALDLGLGVLVASKLSGLPVDEVNKLKIKH